MVGPSLIQHLAGGEVSRNEMLKNMIAGETKESALASDPAILLILAGCQSSDLRRSAYLW
jgi:hypothetical protein